MCVCVSTLKKKNYSFLQGFCCSVCGMHCTTWKLTLHYCYVFSLHGFVSVYKCGRASSGETFTGGVLVGADPGDPNQTQDVPALCHPCRPSPLCRDHDPLPQPPVRRPLQWSSSWPHGESCRTLLQGGCRGEISTEWSFWWTPTLMRERPTPF